MNTKEENPKIIEGRWWVRGPDRPPVPGILEDTGTDLRLKIRLLNEDKAITTFKEVLTNKVNWPSVIHGRDKDDRSVTLFGCHCVNRGWSSGQQRYEFSALTGIHGLTVESWHQPVGQTVALRLDFLHRWLNHRIFEKGVKTESEDSFSLTFIGAFDQTFPVEDGVVIRFSQTVAMNNSWDEDSFRRDALVWFHFKEPKSLHEITRTWSPWIERLMSLLMGTTSCVQEIEVYTHDPFIPGSKDPSKPETCGDYLGLSGKPAKMRISKPSPYDMLVPYEKAKDRLGDILTNWNRVQKDLEPVVGIFSAVALRHALFQKAQFLFLVQALEVYHALSNKFSAWVKPTPEEEAEATQILASIPEPLRGRVRKKITPKERKRNWQERLVELFEAHRDVTERLFGSLEKTAQRIAYTRNQLTHGGEGGQIDRLLNDDEMMRTSWALEAFLWVILLRELGLDGDPVSQIVEGAAGASFISLTEEPSRGSQT